MLIRMYNVYESVIRTLQRENFLDDERISTAVLSILETYSNDGLLKCADGIDFNEAAFRCAYIYLYATSHTHLVYSSLNCFHQEARLVLQEWLYDGHDRKNLLSIGGGPGTDLIGLLLFLQPLWQDFSCAVVDAYPGWEEVLDNTLIVLNTPNYFRTLTVNYRKEDLLKPLTEEMIQWLEGADFITISKFLSAVIADSSATTRLRAMFNHVRVGALVYFVDNAGGGAFPLGERVAESCGLVPVWGPIYHHQFRIEKGHEPMEEVLACPLFAEKRPQTSTKVSIVLWRKISCEPRGLKRPLAEDNCFGNVPCQIMNSGRSYAIARRRIRAWHSRAQYQTMALKNFRRAKMPHRRVVSAPAGQVTLTPSRRSVEFVPKCRVFSPYDVGDIPLPPTIKKPLLTSPYSYSDLPHTGRAPTVDLLPTTCSYGELPLINRTPVMVHTRKVFMPSPYSFTDLSFHVPIARMVRHVKPDVRDENIFHQHPQNGRFEDRPIFRQHTQRHSEEFTNHFAEDAFEGNLF